MSFADNGSATFATTEPLTLTSATLAHSTLYVVCSAGTGGGAKTFTVTDSGSDTFVTLNSLNDTAGQQNETAFYVKNVSAGVTTVTCHASVNANYFAVLAVEITGVSTTAPLISYAGSDQVSLAATTNAATSTGAKCHLEPRSCRRIIF